MMQSNSNEVTSTEIMDPAFALIAMKRQGYRGTNYALAELVDNSIQAEAKNVDIIFFESRKKVLNTGDSVRARSTLQIERIGILDNGTGMQPSVLVKALAIGQGTHLDPSQQKGMGKFGVGLPAASISQCDRIEIWSWTNNIADALYVYLDKDEVYSGKQRRISVPVKKDIPEEWKQYAKQYSDHGTLVVWSNLDSAVPKKSSTVIDHTQSLMGRIYRYFINQDKVSIRAITREDGANQTEVLIKPIDPLFLMDGTPAPLYKDTVMKYKGYPSDSTFESDYEINLYGQKFYVVLRKTYKPGKHAGGTKFGQYAANLEGLSIVRAGRELTLDKNWARSDDTRNRWWGYEIEFNSELDDFFGVTSNKQSATALEELGKTLVSDSIVKAGEDIDRALDRLKEEGDEVRYELCKLVHTIQKDISDMRDTIIETRSSKKNKNEDDSAEDSAEEKTDSTAEDIATSTETEQGGSDLIDIPSPNTPAYEEVKKNLIDALGTMEFESDTKVIDDIERALNEKKRFLILYKCGHNSAAFFEVMQKGHLTIIIIDRNHRFYRDVLAKAAENNNEDDLVTFKLMLLAWAMYENNVRDGKVRLSEARQSWGSRILDLLECQNGK